jgi:hypothetical protein
MITGKFARIGPTSLLVSDVEFLRKVNGPKSKYHRSDWYKGSRFTPNEDTLISMTDEVEHKSLRARMMAGYNLKKENERCESAINQQLGVMLNLIESKYISEPSSGTIRPLDWGYLASYFSIDSITDISFSEPLGDLKEDKDKWNFLHNTEDNLKPMSLFTIYPEILNMIPTTIMVKFMAPHPDDNSPFGMVMGYAPFFFFPFFKIRSSNSHWVLDSHGNTRADATAQTRSKRTTCWASLSARA